MPDLDWTLSTQPVWLMRLFGTVLLTLVLSYSAGLVIKLLQGRLKQNGFAWDDVLLESMRVPVRMVIWVLGLGTALNIVDVDIRNWDDILDAVRRMGVIIGVAWFAFRFSSGYEKVMIKQRQVERGAYDATAILAIGRLLRASIIITAGLVILETLGFSISGVLAFGGIGGIAIGFAAQNMLSNFFGGLMIFLDRPFSVGDWIRSPDRDIEGIVEQIGWRMTIVRTFEKQPIYIPNSMFSSIAVVTPSRMTHRRIQESIGIRYQDVGRLPAILQAIRDLLQNQPGLDPDQLKAAYFERFAASSVNILLQCYTQITDWPKYLALKEEMMLNIARIVETHGAELALPTQTLHLDSAPPLELEGLMTPESRQLEQPKQGRR